MRLAVFPWQCLCFCFGRVRRKCVESIVLFEPNTKRTHARYMDIHTNTHRTPNIRNTNKKTTHTVWQSGFSTNMRFGTAGPSRERVARISLASPGCMAVVVWLRTCVLVCVCARWLLLEQTSKGRSARHPNHRRRPFRTYRICVCMGFGWGTATTTTAADRIEINRVLYLRRVHQPVEMRASKQDIIIKLNYRMRLV